MTASIHFAFLSAQERGNALTLEECLQTAMRESPDISIAQKQYLANFWEYQIYKAGRLPNISLQTTPLKYYSSFVSRYDYSQNMEVYRNQKNLYVYSSLIISQQLNSTGGNIYLQSDLNYLRNIGVNNYSQYSSVPFRIGYSQDLFGYNEFKWEKRLAEMNFKKAQKTYAYAVEDLSGQVAEAFFALATKQILYESASHEVEVTDTLYKEGMERAKISAIADADLKLLELDALTAIDKFHEAALNKEQARKDIALLLGSSKEDINVSYRMEQELPILKIRPTQAILYAKENNLEIQNYELQGTEAKSILEKAKKSRYFEANITASVGFNQVSESFSKAYSNMLRADIVTLTLNIPLVDWGARKATINKAKSTFDGLKATEEKTELTLEKNIEQLIQSLQLHYEGLIRIQRIYGIAKEVYALMQHRFMKGVENFATLSNSRERFHNTEQNYTNALQSFWIEYYTLRKITLYDFEKDKSIWENIKYPK